MSSNPRRTRVRLVAPAVLAALVGLPVAAQNEAYVKRGKVSREGKAWVERIECGASAQPGERLVVRTDLGSVSVEPSKGDGMECQIFLRAYARTEAEARDTLRRFEVSIRRVEGGSWLGARLRHPVRTPLAAILEFRLPEQSNLDLETRGGDLVVERLRGRLRAVTAGGDVKSGSVVGPVQVETAGGGIWLGDIGGTLRAVTAGGPIRVGNVKGDASLETGGGSIVAGHVAGRLQTVTAGGDITLSGAGAAVIADTAGGRIRIGESGGSVRAETLGGSILLDGARGPIRAETAGGSINLFRVFNQVQASTAAGKIQAQFAAAPDSFQRSVLETSFGDIEVYLPPDLPLTIDALIEMAAGHQIHTDFPLAIKGEKSHYQPTTVKGSGDLNGGGEVLTIRTTAGNIYIRMLDSETLKRLEFNQESFKKKLKEILAEKHGGGPR